MVPTVSSNDQTRFVSACTQEQIAARGNRRPVNLAIQGGGAHGAFAWGVLDKLLEDDRLALDAITATSAGSMNAVVMAYGMSLGGRDGAREKLAEFWRAISYAGAIYSPVRRTPWESWLNLHHAAADVSPGFFMFQALTSLLSPYQFNPFDLNPLRNVLRAVVDFEQLRACPRATRLFLSATNVRTGKIRVFENPEISVDVVLASACLPYIFKAVEIDGQHYWDGGFLGNPAIYPVIYRGASRDVIIVHVNPLVRETLPVTAPEIFDRMNEISFNSSLMREMRAIAFVSRLLDEDELLDDRRYRKMLIHSIRDDKEMNQHGVASKLDPDWDFLCHMRDTGRKAAERWLSEQYDKVGHESSIDVGATFL
jgi:NTE family protein